MLSRILKTLLLLTAVAQIAVAQTSFGGEAFEVPLYSWDAGSGHTLDISLSYHTSGVRVEDIPGPAGRGWTLNAGGTTVDPMAEKYPGISPYLYCAGNPIAYIDPTGEGVFVLIKNLQELISDMALLIQNSERKWEYCSVNGWNDEATDVNPTTNIKNNPNGIRYYKR